MRRRGSERWTKIPFWSKARGLSRHHAQPPAAAQRLQRADAAGAGRGGRRGRAGRDLPRAAAHRHRARILVRPGPERADRRRGRSRRCRARRWRNITIRWSASSARCPSRWSAPSTAPRPASSCNIALACDIVLAARSATLPAAVRPARPRARWRRHLAAAAAGRPGPGARAGAAGRAAVRRKRPKQWGLIWKAVDDAA